MPTDEKNVPMKPPARTPDEVAKPEKAKQPQPDAVDLSDESMTGEEDPGSSLDSVVNPLPPANRPS